MDVKQTLRIIADWNQRSSLKQKYWGLGKNLNRIAEAFKGSNREFLKKIIREHWYYYIDMPKPIEGETLERAEAAANWLITCHEKTSRKGASYGYFPCEGETGEGWEPAYPETTGYIIRSLYEYSDFTGKSDYADQAFEMAEWECDIQMPSGAVQGGKLTSADKQVPAIFNTGMVLQGLTDSLIRRPNEKIKKGAIAAADFLVNDLDENGHFQSHGVFVKSDKIKTYNCLCTWPLYQLGQHLNEGKYINAAKKNIEAALGEMLDNGWIAKNCLTIPEAPLLHTIGYSLQGILEVSLLDNFQKGIDAVELAAKKIIATQKKNGFYYGRFYEDWSPGCFSSCLTGSAQFSIVCYRLYEHNGGKEYLEAANRGVNFLKVVQEMDSSNPSMNGCIAGSFPITGDYMTWGYPNWATKYMLDALLLQHKLTSNSK